MKDSRKMHDYNKLLIMEIFYLMLLLDYLITCALNVKSLILEV